mgnify:CR=1 FL=1
MVKVETIEVRDDFPMRDEAYALLRGEDGRVAFAWGWKYPYAEELPAEDVKDGESGFEWYDSEDAARAAMNDAISAWESIRGN